LLIFICICEYVIVLWCGLGAQGKADQVLKESGIPFIIFEPTFFMQNMLGAFLLCLVTFHHDDI